MSPRPVRANEAAPRARAQAPADRSNCQELRLTANCDVAHVGWTTPSLDRSIAFWVDVMGFTLLSSVERTGDWISTFTGVPGARLRIAHLEHRGQRLEFLEFVRGAAGCPGLPPQQACTAHICVRTNDVDELCAAVLCAGGSLQGEITAITEGPSAGVRGLYLRDPCGFLIEVLEAR